MSPDNITGQNPSNNMDGLIQLGNTYRARLGDTWSSLSVRFGIPVDLLQRLNPDFADDQGSFVDGSKLFPAAQAAGSLICIMPETCPAFRPPVPGISW